MTNDPKKSINYGKNKWHYANDTRYSSLGDDPLLFNDEKLTIYNLNGKKNVRVVRST